MLYSYPQYNDELDAEVHVRAFLTTWQANHVSQRLVEADAKRVEDSRVRVILGRVGDKLVFATRPCRIPKFRTFEAQVPLTIPLADPTCELMSKFYAIYQDAHETVPQFISVAATFRI